MKVLVSDTSILIDLDCGAFVEPPFCLSYRFSVPDLQCERELRNHGGTALVTLMFRI